VVHAQPVVPLALGLGQVLIGRVRARELRLAAGHRHVPGRQRGRLDRDAVRGAVDVPVERALEVLRRRVHARVEADLEDLLPALRHDRAELAAERKLGLVVQVQAAEEQHAAPLERFQASADDRVVQQVLDACDLHTQMRAQRRRLDHGNLPSEWENLTLIF